MAITASFQWPPVFASDGDLTQVTDQYDYGQALRYQALTTINEVLFTDDGSSAKYKVFENNDNVLKVQLGDSIRQMLARMFPELVISNIDVSYNKTPQDSPTQQDHFVRVLVYYTHTNTNKTTVATIQVPLGGA